MFAPPPKHVTWHLIELNVKSGPRLELIKAGGLFNWQGTLYHTTPPEPWYPNYGNHRNFKYWEKCAPAMSYFAASHAARSYSYSSQNIDSRLEFGTLNLCLSFAETDAPSGRWVCREWNSRHRGDETLIAHKTHYYFAPADLYVRAALSFQMSAVSCLMRRPPDQQRQKAETEVMWDHSCI